MDSMMQGVRECLGGRTRRENVSYVLLAATLAGFAPGAALAQQSSSTSNVSNEKVEEVIVTGYREALINALELKRDSNVMVDAINADDIASFPDANLAESLQRLPGVSIDRENGEGRSITVRGLGSDFTTVRLNGMDALSTAGGNESGSGPNRSRGFDFNTFASELFSSVSVQKTQSASTDEGSLGAIVDLTTGRPLDYGERKLAFSADGAWYENGDEVNPRFSALASDTWLENTLGALVSVAYSERTSTIDSYQRNPGVFDFTYRQSQHTGKTPNVFGFAQAIPVPAGVSAATYGSNPAALAQFNDTTIIPALGTLSHQELSYQRLGATGTVQWRIADSTLLTADYVYSTYEQDNVSYQLTTVGLNRNGTNARAFTLTGANGLRNDADRARCLCTLRSVDRGRLRTGDLRYEPRAGHGIQFQSSQSRSLGLLQPGDFRRFHSERQSHCVLR